MFSFSTQKDQSRFSYNLESPVVVTRTGPQLEMVEPIQIPDHKLPLNNATNELERLMAITAHPQVLHDSDGHPFWYNQQTEP